MAIVLSLGESQSWFLEREREREREREGERDSKILVKRSTKWA